MDHPAADEGVPLPEVGQSRLVSCRLPNDLHRAVEAAAAKELISVASFARRALLQAVQGEEA
jgi:predicted HicB family RNase H-like nuclease